MSGEPDPVTGIVNQSANPYRALAANILGISPYVYQQNIDSQGAGLGYGALSGAASGLGQAATGWLTSNAGGLLSSAWDTLKSSDWYSSMFGDNVPDMYDPWNEIGGDYSNINWDDINFDSSALVS
jgi:hypothetical protein